MLQTGYRCSELQVCLNSYLLVRNCVSEDRKVVYMNSKERKERIRLFFFQATFVSFYVRKDPVKNIKPIT